MSGPRSSKHEGHAYHFQGAAAGGAGCRVVSVPCMDVFEKQDAAYKAEVLPNKELLVTDLKAGGKKKSKKKSDKGHVDTTLNADEVGKFLSAPRKP